MSSFYKCKCGGDANKGRKACVYYCAKRTDSTICTIINCIMPEYKEARANNGMCKHHSEQWKSVEEKMNWCDWLSKFQTT